MPTKVEICRRARKIVQDAILWILIKPTIGTRGCENFYRSEVTLDEFIKNNTLFLLKELDRMECWNFEYNQEVLDLMFEMFPTLLCQSSVYTRAMVNEFMPRLYEIFDMLHS